MASTWESYLSSIDWTEKIINKGMEQNSKNWLLTEVAEYISDEYNIPTSPNNLAMTKAIELMDGVDPGNEKVRQNPPVVADKSERERKLVFKQTVAEAQRKGYLENFRLQEPWHPRLFMKGEINTYPYQHNSMITFRGVSRDHFYLGGDNPEGKGSNATKRHPKSVLNLGYWNPGNSFNKDNDDAVWTTFKQTAKTYANKIVDGKRGVLLKMQVPTRWIQCGAHKSWGGTVVNNLEEIQEEFGSPESYRKHIKNNKNEQCAWLVRPQVPLEYIIDVWDLELFDSIDPGYALPLQSQGSIDAIDLMHFYQEKKIPGDPEFGDAENHRENIQVMAIKNVVSDSVELKKFCKRLNYELTSIEGKEYNMELIRKVVAEEKNINKLIQNLVSSTEKLGVNTDLDVQNVKQIGDLEGEIKQIYQLSQKVEQKSEDEIKRLISDGKVSNKFASLINSFYLIQISNPKIIKQMEEVETKNQELKQVTNNIIENFRYLKIGGTQERSDGYKNYPIRDFNRVTQKISGEMGGPNEGVNQAVGNLLRTASNLGLDIKVEKTKIEDLDDLQKSLGKILRINKIIDNRIRQNIEDAFTTGKIPDSLTEPMEKLYLIEISEDFHKNVNDSKEKTANELGLLKREVNQGLEIVNWFYQMEVRYAEVVRDSEKARQRGKLTEEELIEIGNALYSYEEQHGRRYGTKHIIEEARRKLNISKDIQENQKESIRELEKGAKKRLYFIRKQEPKIKEIKEEFEHMVEEIEKIRTKYHKVPKEELEKELNSIEDELESLMSKGSPLYDFFSNITNLGWNYTKFRKKVKKRRTA